MPKHQGISYFIVDMKAPGIEIRPIKQIDGGSGFNEVFFNDVRIPDSSRVGEINDGWRCVITTLMNERSSLGMSLGGLGFLFGSPIVIISLIGAVLIFFLEVFVATLQAFVFMFLTAVFIAQMVHHDHGHDEHDGEHDSHLGSAVPEDAALGAA